MRFLFLFLVGCADPYELATARCEQASSTRYQIVFGEGRPSSSGGSVSCPSLPSLILSGGVASACEHECTCGLVARVQRVKTSDYSAITYCHLGLSTTCPGLPPINCSARVYDGPEVNLSCSVEVEN